MRTLKGWRLEKCTEQYEALHARVVCVYPVDVAGLIDAARRACPGLCWGNLPEKVRAREKLLADLFDLGYGYSQVGRMIGVHHSTVMRAVRKRKAACAEK